jgi:dnd system-associated protein 4
VRQDAAPRLRLRDYQERARASWFKSGGVGIFSKATGTGKTVTALATVEELFRRTGPPLVVIFVAPYLHLVRQWVGVARSFGLDPINCSGPRTAWTTAADAALYLVNSRARPVLSFATTNSTFAESSFQDVLGRIQVRTVLIADEVHNLGARALQRALPERVRLRLGLSATPERWTDEDGTKAIRDYFGAVVFDFGLEGALRLGPPVLTPYSYHPILVPLEDDEQEEYMRLTRQLARFTSGPAAENLSDAALGILLKRARLVACARGKLTSFAQTIVPHRETNYNLVYCGDGRVEVEVVSGQAAAGVAETEVIRQVEAVSRLLGRDLGMNVATYTAATPEEEREATLREFAEGRKNALVAIRCLDEGMDIPQVRRAFILASSTNPRQFIQRRGRVLRRAEGIRWSWTPHLPTWTATSNAGPCRTPCSGTPSDHPDELRPAERRSRRCPSRSSRAGLCPRTPHPGRRGRGVERIVRRHQCGRRRGRTGRNDGLVRDPGGGNVRDRIRPPKELEGALDLLKEDKVFETKQKGMMFAAAIGYCLHRDKVGRADIEQLGEGIRLEYFETPDDVGFIDALAIAERGDLRVVANDRQEERIDLFQRFAYLGLQEMKRACYDEKPEYPLYGILKLIDQLDRPEKGELSGLEGLL